MSCMFDGTTTFNQLLKDLDVSSVIFMSNIFVSASISNQPIGNCDVSRVTTMLNMFSYVQKNPINQLQIEMWIA